MQPKIIDVTERDGHPHRALFDRVEAFRFAGGRPGSLNIMVLSFDRVTVARVRSVGHDIALTEDDRVTFLAPLAGQISVEAFGGSIAAGSGGALLIGPGHRRTAVRPGDARHFVGAVAMVSHAASRRRSFGRAFQADGADAAAAAFRDYLRYLLQEVAKPATPLLRPAALRASSALIVDLFAALEAGDPSASLPAAEAHVRKAEAIMRACSDEPLTMQELAHRVGIGLRALQLGFHACRRTMPRAVLTGFRLERARERLLLADAADSVTSIAIDSGFAHFGRFAGAYRARFGETPSETLRRARQ
jgi:AraC-like DNA-binding protein